MKLAPETKKFSQRQLHIKKIDNDIVSVNYEGIVIFPVFGRFGAIRKPDSGSIVYRYNSSCFINS